MQLSRRAPRRLLPPSVLVALALGLAPARAGVLVVDAAGGGEFTSLTAAVAAAADGDTLLVRPGDYSGPFTTLQIVDRSLTIVADGTGAVTTGPITVQQSVAGKRVLLRGLTVVAWGLNLPNSALAAQGGDVLAEDCSFKGLDGTLAVGGTQGAPGVRADAGQLVLMRCSSQGGQGQGSAPAFIVNPTSGGPGLLAFARVSAYGCTFTGGNGGDFTSSGSGKGAPGGHGVSSTNGTLLLAGSTMTGGQGGDGNLVTGSPTDYAGGDAVHCNDLDVLQLLDATLVPGAGGTIAGVGTGPQGDEVDAPFATLTVHPGPYRSYALSSPTAEGGNVQLEFDGEPGDTVGIFAGLLVATLPMPGKQGVFHVGAPLFGPIVLGPVGGPDGTLSLSLPLPVLGLDPDSALLIFEQVFVKPASGPLLLGSPTTHLILDESL